MNNNNHKVNVMYSYVQSYSIYYKICLNIPPMTWKSMLKMKWCKWSIGKESFQLTPPPPKKKKHSSASTKIHSSRIQPVHEYLQHKNFFTQIRIFPFKKKKKNSWNWIWKTQTNATNFYEKNVFTWPYSI